ncbi:MAG: efflux RND transporter permease subunit, partial [Pseudomonadales bacterium]|nr:efflux RND transporter permease subunit [Pseudomonadales bacterium]
LSVVLVFVAGLSALTSLPRIEDPRITTRNAIILTALPGASAERVEALVAKPIEDALRELSEIKTIESTSRPGISLVSIELQDWVGPRDNEPIFSKVRDRLADVVPRLPAGASLPQFDDKRGAVAYSLIVALSADAPGDAGLGVVNRLAQVLGDRLRALPGTEQVVFFGALEEEIEVALDAQELAALGLSPAQLSAGLAAADAKRPAGTVYAEGRELPVEIEGEFDSLARVARTPLASDANGGIVTLGDIATLRKAWRTPAEQIALDQGRRAVLVAVRTEESTRVDTWAERALAVVEAERLRLGEGVELDVVFDQSGYTEARLRGLTGTLLAGAAVVVLVVWLTMGWRSALVVGAALPLSAAASVFGLTFFGEQIHQMTIFGMIIALGLLIDNAIVMTDEVGARLHAGEGRREAVVAATSHLFTPLFASTFTTVLGFMPVFLLPGNVGDFVGPIAIAVVLALMASFLLSMTVIPALAALIVRPRPSSGARWWRTGLRSDRLMRAYERLLHGALAHPLIAMGGVASVALAGFVVAAGLGLEFFPPADRDQLELRVSMPGGTGIDRTRARVAAIEAVVREHAGVERLTWVAGASSPPVYYNQLRDQDRNPAHARGVVRLESVERAQHLGVVLQERLAQDFPDAQIVVKAFGQGPPVKAPVGFRIVGPDLDKLRIYGERLRALMHEYPEITYTEASIGAGVPKLWLQADEYAARLAGLSLAEMAEQLQGALEGAVGGTVLEGLESLPVRVRYAPEAREDLARIAALSLQGDAEDWIPANALGSVTLRPQLPAITRRNGERINEVLAFLRPGALPIEVAARIDARIAAGELELASGYRVQAAGDSAEQQSAVSRLLTYLPVLGVLMLATLILAFRSVTLAALIAVVALLSLGLGLLSLALAGYPLGFNPIIGSAGLVGVAINGSIVVLAAIRADARARAGDPQAIVARTLGATRHIVSTTLTTVAGFTPLLLFTGGEFWPPLAVVIAGGVGLGIVLSLLFTPTAYRLLAPRLERTALTA